jgi:Ca2+:H+ antiporter
MTATAPADPTAPPPPAPPARKRLNPMYYLLAAAPVAVAAELLHWSPLAIFATSALAILPLSALLGHATEQLAGHAGPTVGGLLNATLGNLAELIIGALALRAGLIGLVAASITGSILGNLLLVLGASMLAGGLKHSVQKFNPQMAGMNGSLLVTAVVGLVVPALFAAAHPDPQRVQTVRLSEWVAGLLVVGYVLSLVYSMYTHRAAFTEGGDVACGEEPPEWSLKRAIAVLAVTAAVIGVLSEFLVGATEEASRAIGLSDFFVGLVVVPIIGNAAEHSTAVLMARKNRMDLAVNIALGSCVQVALLVAPILVFLGVVFGQPMTLAFSGFEVASVTLAVLIALAVINDAESNWLEGALLLLVYAVLAVAFFLF